MDLKPPVNVNNSHVVRKAEQHAEMVTTSKPSEVTNRELRRMQNLLDGGLRPDAWNAWSWAHVEAEITTLYKTSTAGESDPRNLDGSLVK